MLEVQAALSVLAVAVIVFDARTTNRALELGAYEKTPFNVWAQSHLGSVWWAPMALVTVVSVGVLLWLPAALPMGTASSWGLIAIAVGAIAYRAKIVRDNMAVIAKLESK